jgi:rhamnose utilization protein RhaD (predicted bifunctional aldolase and dehydrogenase)
METALEHLIHMSHEVGHHIGYIQGGGGNTSVKYSSEYMAIKSSGSLLKDVSAQAGHTKIHYAMIRKAIIDGLLIDQSANQFNRFLYTTMLDETSPVPSIEAGLHAILPYTYVLHTHSVYANILTCSQEGQTIFKNLFPEALWVPYATPGKDITLLVANQIKSGCPNVIFMQNHGLLVGGDTVAHTLDLHEQINDKIRQYFKLSQLDAANMTTEVVIKNHQSVLFPDQVVYLESRDLRETQAGLETYIAYAYILDSIKTLNLTPHFMSPKNIAHIQNLDSEKHRQKVVKL